MWWLGLSSYLGTNLALCSGVLFLILNVLSTRFNLFAPNAIFIYPLKTSENLGKPYGFLCFQEV